MRVICELLVEVDDHRTPRQSLLNGTLNSAGNPHCASRIGNYKRLGRPPILHEWYKDSTAAQEFFSVVNLCGRMLRLVEKRIG